MAQLDDKTLERMGHFEHNFDFQNYSVVLQNSELVRARGQVVQVLGLIIEALLQGVRIAELCLVKSADKTKVYPCEVVGFKARRVLLMPLVNIEGIGAGCDEEAIRVFAENLRQLLLASPLGNKRVMAIDPGF
ncbi:hypothetical protein EON78_01850, partial [bacterium]